MAEVNPVPTLRLTAALASVTACLVVMVARLMRDSGIGELALCGAIGGAAAGACWRGRRWMVLGLLLGAGVGLIAPFLYMPFWIAFTLPPHPDVDL